MTTTTDRDGPKQCDTSFGPCFYFLIPVADQPVTLTQAAFVVKCMFF